MMAVGNILHAGVKSSGAVVKVFRHNDMAHLEKLLRFHIAEGQSRTHRPWKKVSPHHHLSMPKGNADAALGLYSMVLVTCVLSMQLGGCVILGQVSSMLAA